MAAPCRPPRCPATRRAPSACAISARKRPRRDKPPFFEFYRANVAVNHYYFYVLDRDWGPGFIKFSSYAPLGVRVCINGHAW
jgi:hypothetical protein